MKIGVQRKYNGRNVAPSILLLSIDHRTENVLRRSNIRSGRFVQFLVALTYVR